jgi:hypothetical protein
MVFGVNYDLRHTERLVSGANWTVNDKEHSFIRSCAHGNYKNWVFLEELHVLSCFEYGIRNDFFYGKQKKKTIKLLIQNLQQVCMLKI